MNVTKNIVGNLFALTMALGLSACSHQKALERKVDQDIKEQPTVTMGGPMAAESRKLIAESPELTPMQKERLLELHSRMAGEMMRIRDEEGKLKMVFFRTLLNPKSDEGEISSLRRRIIKLDRGKTEKMLSALEEARGILGRKEFNDDRLYRVFNMEGPGHREVF